MELIAKTFEELNTRELYEILKARSQIFLLEQGIVCQDMDDEDYNSLHCFFTEEGKVTAYLRAFYIDKQTVKIGRVLTLKHGNGTGRELMNQSLKAVEEKMNCKKITVNAQKQAMGFYEKLGFKVTSDEFLEERVVHVKMDREL